MATKTTEKSAPHVGGATSTEELRQAYQVHALAHLVYGQISASYPWVESLPVLTGFAPPAGGSPVAPWAQHRSWPGTWGYPMGWGL